MFMLFVPLIHTHPVYVYFMLRKVFFILQRAHKPNSLRTDRTRKLAMMSDDKSQMEYFKKYLLKPMLIERQVGSPGSLLVQKVKKFCQYSKTLLERPI